jgi:hypothetical protein
MTNPERAKLQKLFSTYLKELREIYTGGNFREESFYPALKDLFEDILICSLSKKLQKRLSYQNVQKWVFRTFSFVKMERL